jgi:hypothetical protein
MQAAGAQQYDPTNSTPYQAVEAPVIAPAMPSPLPAQGPEINGAVKKSGAAATILDGILRGAMQGHAWGQERKVMQLKAKGDNLNNSYNQDAVRLLQLTQAGVDPNSDEYKAADSAVQGSWGALQDFRGTVLAQNDGGKKKGKKKDQQLPPQAVLTNPASTPQDKAEALYEMSKKFGPPVYGQIAMINTPEAKAKRQAAQTDAQTGVQAAQNNQTAAGQQGQQLQHQQAQLNAQKKIDDLNKTPQSQWTPAMWEQYNQAQQQIEPRKSGDEAKVAADAIIRKSEADPKYQFTDQDKEVLRGAGYKIDPKLKTQVTKTGEIIQFPEDGGPPEILRSSQKEYESKGRAPAGGGKGGPADKTYKKWDDYYKEHYPDMSQTERDALVKHKVEGASQEQSGLLAHDAVEEPKQFDNDLLTAAVDKLRSLPQYKDMKSFDDALANLVGQGENGFQYHSKSDIGKPDKHGKYSGDVTADQLKNMERDLQTQIRTILTGPKETALSPQARRAVVSRMQPLFGPSIAPAGSTGTPESPQAGASPTGAASSPSSAGGKKGVVKKSAFLKENPGATDADWQAIKPQLKDGGYDPRDE